MRGIPRPQAVKLAADASKARRLTFDNGMTLE
jgi:hypothetical protein